MDHGATGTPLEVWVKEAKYDEKKDGWLYLVQEKDKTGEWYGNEYWKSTKMLRYR